MRLKTDAAAKVKNGASALFEPPVHREARTVSVQQKKPGIASSAKAVELDPAFLAPTQAEDFFAQQSPPAPAGYEAEGVALAALDPTWYVEPGTAPAATDAPKPNWFAAPARAEPSATEPPSGTVIGQTTAPATPAPAARGPVLSPMGLNAIGLGGLGLGFGLAGGGGGGGGGSGGGGTTAAKAPTSSIKVVDGPISGAKVYLDMNDNGKYDASIDKLVGTTDANGSLDIASASLGQHGLLAVGGTNDNGMPNMSTLSLAAVANTSAPLLVLSPLTSLVSAVYLRSLQSNSKTSFTDAEKATKLSEAESAVKSALGLDTVSASFSSIDPTGAGGLQLLKVGAVLAAMAAVPQTLTASSQDSLASYILSDKPKNGALLTQLASSGGLHTLFASSLDGLSGKDKSAASMTLSALETNNGALLKASSTDLSSIANLLSNTDATPKILGLSYDTGSSATDKITSLAQLSVYTLGGTTQLRVEGGTDWVDTSSFAPQDGLVKVTARSKYGTGSDAQYSAVSEPFSFTLISVVPAAPTLALNSDTGVSANDHITKDGTFSISPTPANGILRQYSTDGLNWEAFLTDQEQATLGKDGAHTVYVRHIVPSVGLSSAKSRLDFTLDTQINADTNPDTPSVLEIEGADWSSTDGITRNEEPTLQGDTDPGNTVAFTLPGGPACKVVADAYGHWTFNTALSAPAYKFPEGPSDITLNVSDAAGWTATKHLLLTVDTKPPDDTTVSFNPPTSKATVGLDADQAAYINPNAISADTPLVFSGTADRGATVDLYVSDTFVASVKTLDNGSWSFPWNGLVLVKGEAGAEDSYAPLAKDTSYTLQVVVTDLAGNPSDTLNGTVFTLDTTAPDSTTVEPADLDSEATLGTDASGVTYFNAGRLNSEHPLNFSGTADPGAMVKLYIVDTKTGTSTQVMTPATASLDDGNWSFAWDGMVNGNLIADGRYTASVVVTDLAGIVSEALPASGSDQALDRALVILGFKPPAAETTVGLDPEGVAYFNPDPISGSTPLTFSGTAERGATVDLYIDDTPLTTVTASSKDGTWSYAWNGTVDGAHGAKIAQGTHTLQFVLKDLAGNASDRLDGVSFTVDATAPDSTTVKPEALASEAIFGTDEMGVMYLNADSLNSDYPLTFSGTADLGATVELYIADTETDTRTQVMTPATASLDDGSWSFAWDGMVDGNLIADGRYTASVVVIDLAGNASSEALPASVDSQAFVIDTKAPDASTISAALADGMQTGADTDTGDVYTSHADVTISGTADALANLLVGVGGEDYEVTADKDGSWSLVLTGLKDDGYTVSVTATDLAGNTSALVEVFSFIVDTVPEYFSGSSDAGYGPVIGKHITMVVGTDSVDMNPFEDLADHVAPNTTFDYADSVNVLGTLPTGLTLGDDGHITGTPAVAGQTWLEVHSYDFAGNESIIQVQLVVSKDDPATVPSTISNRNAKGDVTRDGYQYTATDLADNINIKYGADDVLFTGKGNDVISIGSTTIDSSKAAFSRVDGGDGTDTLSFLYKGENIDLSNFNNPDGSGGVLQHIEVLKFAGDSNKQSSVNLSAADVFNLQCTDADGNAFLSLTADKASDQFVKAKWNATDFTQEDGDFAYTGTGVLATGTDHANFSKFHGSYTDNLGPHDVTLLVQGYYILG
jgi:hypothetical protein